jgi:hypothetical protein
VLVWVDDWQQQCCGEPFAVGSRVDWMLHRRSADDPWLAAVLGADLAGEVTHAEEHHSEGPADVPVTRGVVTRIRTVSCRYAALGDDPLVLSPVPGTSQVVDVHEADAWFEPPEPLRLNGFVVDLEPVRG